MIVDFDYNFIEDKENLEVNLYFRNVKIVSLNFKEEEAIEDYKDCFLSFYTHNKKFLIIRGNTNEFLGSLAVKISEIKCISFCLQNGVFQLRLYYGEEEKLLFSFFRSYENAEKVIMAIIKKIDDLILSVRD